MPYLSLSAGSMNTVLEVDIDSTNVVNPLVRCQFEPGFTIDYGIDPLYTDLTGRDTTSTLGRVTTITFSQDLIGDTTYYFSVSAESTSQCVRIRRHSKQVGGYTLVIVERDCMQSQVLYLPIHH